MIVSWSLSCPGPKYVGPIHGRVLLASSAAALAGPSILLSLRSQSEVSAIHDLVSKVDPARFQQVFHAGVEEAQALIDVSILRIEKCIACIPRHEEIFVRLFLSETVTAEAVIRNFACLMVAVSTCCGG